MKTRVIKHKSVGRYWYVALIPSLLVGKVVDKTLNKNYERVVITTFSVGVHWLLYEFRIEWQKEEPNDEPMSFRESLWL